MDKTELGIGDEQYFNAELDDQAEYNVNLFRQNTYLQNKKHTLTCQVGLVVTDLITSPVVSWEGWETPPPPSTEAQLSFFAQPPAW